MGEAVKCGCPVPVSGCSPELSPTVFSMETRLQPHVLC